MLTTLQIVLVSVSLLTAVFLMGKIRKSQFLIEDTLFWIAFSVLILILSLIPQIPAFFSKLLGFESPSNFIIVAFIFLLIIKIFSMNIKITKLEVKLKTLTQKYAIDKKEESDKK